MVNGARRIRSKKLREHQYIGYARFLESKRVDWEEGRNLKQMWEQMKL